MKIPFYRPSITQAEIDEVVQCLQSGWLTTGPRTRQFETEFSNYVRQKHSVALNSCTAALHLGLEAIGLKEGDTVVGPQYAAPTGRTAWWVPNPPGELAHVGAMTDPRILSDVLRRLRGEKPWTTHPPALRYGVVILRVRTGPTRRRG